MYLYPNRIGVGIIGLGLIGGSIGLSLKKNRLVDKIIGFGRNKERLEEAKKLGVIDKIGEDFADLAEVDIVFLATPVLKIIEIGKEVSKFIKEAIVSDAGSTKTLIVKELSPLIPRFVGAHPMAGSHKSGIKFASDSLFSNACVVLTPNNRTEKEAKGVISSLWKGMGAKVVEMSPELHDELVALSSHIPHITSNILIELISGRKEAQSLISSGFKDMTRLSLSDPHLWNDIFLTNKENIIKGLDKMIEVITKWKGLINNNQGLLENLEKINKITKEVFKERF
ncbi:MAG: prephenate dehydrogenase/arogenate dehydrogenase family protein [bacterium]